MLSRIITSISLILILFLILFISNNIIFNIFLYLVILLCTKEWNELNKLKYFSIAFNLILLLFAALSFIFYFYVSQNQSQDNLRLITRFIINLSLLWLPIFIIIFKSNNLVKNKIFLYLSGFLILLILFTVILDIKFNLIANYSYYYINLIKYPQLANFKSGILLLSVILLIAINDSGAFFTGKLIGKSKLARDISPNKTVEGLLGGIVASLLFSTFLYYFIFNLKIDLITWLIFIFSLVIIANLGDLAESKLKRISGVKDSGNILPGHGGMLDRLDSHLVAIPIFWFYMVNFVLT